MKIAHFNTFLHGGAATAAIRIHEGLQHFRRTIVSSEFFYRFDQPGESKLPTSTHPEFKSLPLEPSCLNRFSNPLKYRLHKQRQHRIFDQFNTHLAKRSATGETFAMAELPEPTSLQWQHIDAEIVNLHWVSFLADYPSFFSSIPLQVPIVWTLHDMNAFSGGCHYNDQCLNYRIGCGTCPQVVRSQPTDVSRSTFEVKKQALAQRKITVVSPSHWLKNMAQLSPVWPNGTEFKVIRYGLDLQRFFPIDKKLARQTLGIDHDGILFGFGAADVKAPRKGVEHLLNALRLISAKSSRDDVRQTPIEAIVFGTGTIIGDSSLPPIRQFGFVDSVERQRLIYSAIDFVVIPSREDNQPQVGLEAMACGTPVVAFSAGGIPEYVRDGETGLLAPPGDEATLARLMMELADNKELRFRLGSQARQMMETEFEIGCQSARYIELYQALVNRANNLKRNRHVA